MVIILARQLERKGILRVRVGVPVDLLCFAYDGYPQPSFLWLAPTRHNLSATLQIYEVTHTPDLTHLTSSDQTQTEWSNTSHTVSSSSLARYSPAMEDNNHTISCTVNQEEEGGSRGRGTVHFTKTFVFKLEVTESPNSSHRNEIFIKEISFITSIIVAFFFLIFLSILLCVSKYRRKTKLLKNPAEKTRCEMAAASGNTFNRNLSKMSCYNVKRWSRHR